MVKFYGASIDGGAVLNLLEFLELNDQCLDHSLGRVDFVVVSGFSQGGFDDVTCRQSNNENNSDMQARQTGVHGWVNTKDKNINEWCWELPQFLKWVTFSCRSHC